MMSTSRLFPPRRRTVAAVVAAAAVITVAVSVKASGTHASPIAQAADVSQASAAAICSTSGPGGTWTISAGGIATLAPGGTLNAPATPCMNVSLPDPGTASLIQQCASALQEAQQQFQQESAEVLFSSFMENLIQNNAGRWASALAAQGYQGPAVPASSQEVSDAINQVWGTNYDLANAIVQALQSLVNHDFDVKLDCSTEADSTPNWYSNAFQALADDSTQDDLLNQALNAVAGQVAQWAMQGLSPDGTIQSGSTHIQ